MSGLAPVSACRANRYLYFVQPLVDAATFAKTKLAVEDFRTGAGPKLQLALEGKDQAHPETSYVAGTRRRTRTHTHACCALPLCCRRSKWSNRCTFGSPVSVSYAAGESAKWFRAERS